MTSSLAVKAPRSPSPHTPLPQLLNSLRRSGWGIWAGRPWGGVRSVLEGLVARLPHGSGMGKATVPQIAQAAGGMSARWVARCLEVLEAAGLIAWQRGGMVQGKAVPSYFRINKKALVECIDAARPLREAQDLARREATWKKAGHLRFAFGRHRTGERELLKAENARLRRSVHVELSTTLPHLRVEALTPPPLKDLYAPTAVGPDLPESAPEVETRPTVSPHVLRREGETWTEWFKRVNGGAS